MTVKRTEERLVFVLVCKLVDWSCKRSIVVSLSFSRILAEEIALMKNSPLPERNVHFAPLLNIPPTTIDTPHHRYENPNLRNYPLYNENCKYVMLCCHLYSFLLGKKSKN